MKKTILGSVLIGMIAFSAFTFKGDIYKVDTKTSSMEWIGKKLTGEHNGTIMLSSGEVEVTNGTIAGGKFDIDMATINDRDLQDPTYKAKLENHLKSEDWFDVKKFPKATFVITSVTPIKEAKDGGYTHTVKGNLTLKEKTNAISFDAVIKMTDGKVACVGQTVIDRSKFDVKYNSKTFFPEIGDKLIYDEFTVKFSVVAVK
ncbi:MAG: YceI family protein [Bacteroidetes bacterium]|nr:YceI family protein [Bacteroidota bacterium]